MHLSTSSSTVLLLCVAAVLLYNYNDVILSENPVLLSVVVASPATPTKKKSTMPKFIVFSDVDGTLVHYPNQENHMQQHQRQNDRAHNNELIHLPPSKTGTRGVLSKHTLELCQALRQGKEPHGNNNSRTTQQQSIGRTPLVLISGMRTTTLFQRLPYLPIADAYVSESGGRIFYPVPIDEASRYDEKFIPPIVIASQDGQFMLLEDHEWRTQISDVNAAGPDGFHDVPMKDRTGKVWEYGKHLTEKGYVLDTVGYATAFRINRKMQSGTLLEHFDELLKSYSENGTPSEYIGSSTNLGCIDIYPFMSGKKKCCEYLVKRFLGMDAELSTNAYCMCDDDNDIEMALSCKSAFLPSVTSESIRRILKLQGEESETRHYGKLVVTEDVGKSIVKTKATERALEMILEEIQLAHKV
eukprot:scaffold4255_cov69-Cyclotella_meneghiniana.AAC.2